MKVKLLVSGVLVDEDAHEWGGIYETHDVSKTRGEYLVSIGAAEEVKPARKAKTEDDGDGKKETAPEAKKDEPPATPAPAPEPAPAPAKPAPAPAPRKAAPAKPAAK